MKIYSLKKLVEIARHKSPFYKKLYKNIKTSNFHLSDLPIIDPAEFWKANTNKNNRIITGPARHGILLRSGGTTGHPKTSVFSSEEWLTLCEITAIKVNKSKLVQAGDRVTNMFVYGSLYGGFLVIHNMLQGSSVHTLELPIGIGQELNVEEAVMIIKELNANVIITPPYAAVSIAHYIKSNKIKGIHIDRFLYAADMFLDSQYQYIKSVFPKATISSSGYASTDAGFLGFADSTCKMNEYRTDDQFTIMEIVDEKTGKVIEDENIKGRLLATNLTKTLMPVIRYPVGDLAMWCEPKGSKFRKLKLMGRRTKKYKQLTFRGVEYSYQDLYDVINHSKHIGSILGFQIVLSGKKIEFKIACETKNRYSIKLAKNEIKRILFDSIPGINKNLIEITIFDVLDLSFVTRGYKSIKIVEV